MKKSIFLVTNLLISLSSTLIISHQSSSVETCTPLGIVGGEPGQTYVHKTVSLPEVPVGFLRLKRDDWNTDFSVQSGVKYKRFNAILTPQTQGSYDIKMYLKYSDGTADEVYKNQPVLSPEIPLFMTGKPRVGNEPYQVNIFVGDLESAGKSYNISVQGCK